MLVRMLFDICALKVREGEGWGWGGQSIKRRNYFVGFIWPTALRPFPSGNHSSYFHLADHFLLFSLERSLTSSSSNALDDIIDSIDVA